MDMYTIFYIYTEKYSTETLLKLVTHVCPT